MNQLRIPVLAALMMFAAMCYAQSPAIDSMNHIADNQTGEQKVNTLINISRQHFIAQDTQAMRFAHEALTLSEQMNYDEGKGKALLFLGLAWADVQPDTALRYYLKSSEILSAMNHSWAHFGFKNASDIYMNKGWYPEALQCIYKVFEINQKAGDTLQMVESLSTMGFLHSNIQNYEEALYWQRLALETLGEKEHPTRRGLILGRIGINYDETGNYDSALYYNNLAIGHFRAVGDVTYVAQWMSNLANTHLKLGNFAEAERLLTEALSLNDYDDRKPNIFNNLAKVYIETGRYQAARSLLDSAFYFAGRFQMKDVLSESWYRTYELNKAQGKIQDALDAYIQYSVIRDSMLNEIKTGQLAQMLARYETESKEKALLFEKAENARIQAEKVQAQLLAIRTQKWVWGISLFASLLVVLIPFILIYYTRKVQHEKNLAIIEEQKKGLASMIRVQEDERIKIARELHDGIGQQISAVSLNFQAMTRKLAKEIPEVTADSEKIKRLILDTSENIRAISHQMMPRALTQFGLVDALEDIVEISFRNSSIQCEFSHKNMAERLPQEIETGIYRIAQELISNVIRHSGAGHVFIQLYRTIQSVILTVEDDGKGIEQTESKGIGITNIKSRVQALTGSFTLESKPGKGTLATVKLNL